MKPSTKANWQIGIAFNLCIYGKRNNEKITVKYLFYNTGTFF